MYISTVSAHVKNEVCSHLEVLCTEFSEQHLSLVDTVFLCLQYPCKELSDPVTMGIFQEKSFDHADLSNKETIESGETGEDDKAITTEVSEFAN